MILLRYARALLVIWLIFSRVVYGAEINRFVHVHENQDLEMRLILAFVDGNAQEAERLIRAGADIHARFIAYNARFISGQPNVVSFLVLAVHLDRPDMIRMLLVHDQRCAQEKSQLVAQDCNEEADDRHNYSDIVEAMLAALKDKNIACLNVLLPYIRHIKKGELKNILEFAHEVDFPEAIELLIPYIEYKGSDAIDIIAQVQNPIPAITWMLQNGISVADMERTNTDPDNEHEKYTPLSWALCRDNIALMRLLIEAGADVPPDLLYDMIERWHDLFPVDALHERTNILQRVLSSGASVHYLEHPGDTPLVITALSSGHAAWRDILLYGARLSQDDLSYVPHQYPFQIQRAGSYDPINLQCMPDDVDALIATTRDYSFRQRTYIEKMRYLSPSSLIPDVIARTVDVHQLKQGQKNLALRVAAIQADTALVEKLVDCGANGLAPCPDVKLHTTTVDIVQHLIEVHSDNRMLWEQYQLVFDLLWKEKSVTLEAFAMRYYWQIRAFVHMANMHDLPDDIIATFVHQWLADKQPSGISFTPNQIDHVIQKVRRHIPTAINSSQGGNG